MPLRFALPHTLVALLLLSGCDSGEPWGEASNPCGTPQATASYGTFFSDPAWHPGGRYVAAEHADSLDTDGDGRFDAFFPGIWLVDAETGETQPLLAGYSDPAWSPDGEALAVGRGVQIYTVEVESLSPARVDMASLRQLTTEGRNIYSAWSPDGEWIAFSSDKDADQIPGAFGYAIYKMRSDGSDLTDISEHGTGEWLRPDWSPSGDRIAHERYITGAEGTEIVTMSSTGGDPLRLTSDDNSDMQPRYNPDGTRIAFQSETARIGSAGFYIQTVNTDGTGLRRLALNHAWSFDWSPDGRHLVFLRLDPTTPARWSGQLWLMEADGSNARQLTDYFPAWGRIPHCFYG